MITQSTRVVFVKQIPLAGQAIAAAVATRLGCSRAEARQQRLEMVKAQLERATEPGHQELPQPAALAARTAANAGRLTRAEPTASGNVQATATVAPPRQAKSAEDLAAIEAAAREQADQLARELTYCIRYYRSLHSDRPIDRVVFIGGEAHHRSICQQIARGLQLPAQLGDPMLRLHRTHWGVDCGDLTVGVPAPEWAIAFGCSLAGHESGG